METHDSPRCPDCGELGEYQGAGCDGDAWTGTPFSVRYCGDCDISWRMKMASTPVPA